METEWVGGRPPAPRKTPRRRNTRARWARLLLVLVLLALVLHLAAGWYYADQIRSQALTVNPWTWPRDEQLAASDTDSVTIRDLGAPDAELRTEGTFELVWDGGSVMVGGRPVIEGDLVTRQLEGSAHLPAPGTPVGLSSFVTDPDLPQPRQVQYRSPLGPMAAELVRGDPSTWAILVHGKGSSSEEMHRLMSTLQRFAVTMLDISYRNDAGNPKDAGGQYQYGATEWADLAAAVQYARARGARHLVLAGASMGGSIVAAYLRHASDTHDLAAVILDAPMLDLRSTVAWGAAQLAITPPPTITWTAEELAGLRFGVDWNRLDYLHDETWVTVPTLVLHGDADTTVPLETSRQLAANPLVRLAVFPGAGHVEEWNVDRDRYDHEVAQLMHTALPWQPEMILGN